MRDRLRIALVSPLALPTRPDIGSSIEQLVSLLAAELTRRGHEVTLFASGDSQTEARLHAVYPRSYKEDSMLWNYYEFHEIVHVAAAFEQAERFDVIHSHAYHHALPFTRLVSTPVLHTYHINPTKDILSCYSRYPETQVVAVSQYHRSKFTTLDRVAVVYNGIDIDAFPFHAKRGDYLVFLGHLIHKKGALEAIQIAQQVGMRLVMAGQTSDYFYAEIEPWVDGKQVEYIGYIGVPERNKLLAEAAALLFPINASEPFGLVMLEAMACGTPVAAIDRCAVSEIVEPGVTGYYAADIDALAALIPDTLALDRYKVRKAIARFDYRRMVDGYESLYRQVLEVRQ
ncbi:glycosyltransferase family 4 protein [Chroococcidiopsis sp. CCNUC1]|uniref:glycosyltransferase family 4 protein n=1 Tax=Chroococcidiopsis sp. CCNUC1 TaxID=2653189 RepID=UPI0020223122|nr:glycosyltransferase family 4 protein [Chroococcidiopsis sp. CCNUC1]URD51294.1 glycosyltransferase family 4 protein [Chroococcidiopsis sp. CCNUC1]